MERRDPFPIAMFVGVSLVVAIGVAQEAATDRARIYAEARRAEAKAREMEARVELARLRLGGQASK